MARPVRAPSKRLSAVVVAFLGVSAARQAADGAYARVVVTVLLAVVLLYYATRPLAYFEWARHKPLGERLIGLAVVLPILVVSVVVGGAWRFAPIAAVCAVAWWDHRRFRAFECSAPTDDVAQAIQR